MVSIFRYHGLIPIPLDLDVNSLAPAIEELEKKITPNTKIIMFAHIYGAYNKLSPLY